VPDQDDIKKMLKRQREEDREDAERRHRELIDELRARREFDPRGRLRRGFAASAEKDRQAREAGARTPREVREARKQAGRG
jgi:hypothetical protein